MAQTCCQEQEGWKERPSSFLILLAVIEMASKVWNLDELAIYIYISDNTTEEVILPR